MNGFPAGLHFHSNYANDGTRRRKLNMLVEETFGIDLTPLVKFDFEDPAVVPFSCFDESGACIANASVYPVRTMFGGKQGEAFAMQSVATSPAWRLKGLFRELVSRALAWCDARAPFIILTTDTPALYTRFGFTPRPRSRFLVRPGDVKPDMRTAARRLDIRADAELVKRLLSERTPVSNRMALVDHGAIFFLEAASDPELELHYLPEHDVMVSVARQDGEPPLIGNIVGRTIPPLPVLLATLGGAPEIVEFAFPPDRIGLDAEELPLTSRATVMTRGDFPATCEGFRIPLGGI